MVQDRIDAAVGTAEPLGDRHDVLPHFELVVAQVRTQFQHAERQIEREPGQREGHHDGQQHSQRPHFRALQLYVLRRRTGAVLYLQLPFGYDLARNLPIPQLLPHKAVAQHLRF